MNYEELLKIVVLSFVVSPICLTVTKTEVFKPLRVFIKSKSGWLGKLFSCPYCFSHWTSFGAVSVFQPIAFSCGYSVLIDLAVSAFVMVAITNLLSGLIFWSIDTIS